MFTELLAGTGEKVQASTTTAFARLLRNLLRDPDVGHRIVPIIPDEARTFGLDALVPRREDLLTVRADGTSRSTPTSCRRYQEAKDGRILEEGITEAGAMASMTAVGTSYATWGNR